MTKQEFKVWVDAARPKTLAAAFAPVLIGASLAYQDGSFDLTATVITFVCAFLIQIGTNFANDYYDHINGTDTEERIGFTRATASGLIPAKVMLNATIITMLFAFVTGLYLVYIAGWPILVIGILSIIFGVLYTGGPYPLGYNGLGDIFVFIFFGIIAVMGTYYVNAFEWSTKAFIASLPAGALSVNILVVNNLRDVEQDKKTGKRTLGVILGDNALKIEYTLMMLLAFLSPLVLIWNYGYGPALYSTFFLLPIMGILLHRIITNTNKPLLNHMLERTAQFLALFSVTFSTSILFA